MTRLRYVLSGEGTSDAMLLPILNWLLSQHLPGTPLEPEFTARVREGQHDVANRVKRAVADYRCDLLFVHRDADNRPPLRERRDEIAQACVKSIVRSALRTVSVVPVRMSEAWLLCDELAIRRAADNSPRAGPS